jgi:hypothetical protein
MIAPLISFTIRDAISYRDESNASRAKENCMLLPAFDQGLTPIPESERFSVLLHPTRELIAFNLCFVAPLKFNG